MFYDTNISSNFIETEDLNNTTYCGYIFNTRVPLKNINKKIIPVDIKLENNKKTYNRIEIVMNSSDSLNLRNFDKSDIFSIRLEDSENLDKIIELNPDIITFNFKNLHRFKIKHIKLAIRNNIYIEIPIVDSLYSRENRLNWLDNVKQLMDISKGKNIIIGSGATCSTELKSPIDIVKMLSIFGICENKGYEILKNAEKLLYHCSVKRYSFKNCILNNIEEGTLKKDFIINKYFRE